MRPLHEHSKSFKSAFDHIIKVEGSEYTNHPADRGGPVKFGITLIALQEFRKTKILTADDIKNLKIYDAMEIYKFLYWDRIFLDQVDDHKIALVIFDNAVNCGTGAATKLVQGSLNKAEPWMGQIPVTGVMTQETIAALNNVGRIRFGFQFFKGVQGRYITIVKKDPTQIVFLHGWLNRTYKILENIL